MTGDRGAADARIGITGTFDVRNYGDLLFPLVARHELAQRGLGVVPFSPSDTDTAWKDALPSRRIDEIVDGTAGIAGILIGGGNIVHADTVTLPDYQRGSMARHAYASLWLGASLGAAVKGWPIAWNAPGVPHPFAQGPARDLAALALGRAGYRSVRDDSSAGHLPTGQCAVVPDTCLGLARLWSRSDLEPAWRRLWQRQGAAAPARTLAVHVKERSLSTPPEALAARLDAFAAATGVVPLLVAIGHCHGDDRVTRRIAKAMTGPHIDLAHPLGLQEIAAAIAFSTAYLGASMHGYVTAAAYGVPGVVVGRPRIAKIAGLLRHLDRPGDEVGNWEAGLDRIAGRLVGDGAQLPDHIGTALGRHWDRVAATLATRPAPQPSLAPALRRFRQRWQMPGAGDQRPLEREAGRRA